MDERHQITAWFKNHEIKLTDGQLDSLLAHAGLVREHSPQLNLVGKNDLPDLVDRHILDSLQALTVYDIPAHAMVADFGSGAGFPGIPIAIVRPDVQMYLIESRRRRSLFLSKIINSIGLANAMVINDRWERISLVYDVILARALIREDQIWDSLSSRLAPGGSILYYAKYNNIKVLRGK